MGLEFVGGGSAVEVVVREPHGGSDGVSRGVEVASRVRGEPLRAAHAAAGDLDHLLHRRRLGRELEHADQRALRVPVLHAAEVQEALELVQPAPQLLAVVRLLSIIVRGVVGLVRRDRVLFANGRSVDGAPVPPEPQSRGHLGILRADRPDDRDRRERCEDGDEAREGAGSTSPGARSRRHGPLWTLHPKLAGSRVRYP